MKRIFCLFLFFLSFRLMAGGTIDTAPPFRDKTEPIRRVIVDSYGREVELPAVIERIACLYAFSGHVATMLGRGDDIVAVVPGLKRDKILNQINPSLAEASAASLDGVLNIEELLRMDPDIIFLKGESARIPAEVEKLERFNLPYIVIDYQTIQEQMEAIQIIAETLGAGGRGREYLDYYQGAMDRVGDYLKDLPREERFRVYHSVNEAVRTDAPGTLPAEWLALAGVENVSLTGSLKFRDNKYFASLEQIYLWDPEIILVNESGVDHYLLTNEKWAGLRAVRNQKVYQIPIGISRWGHPGGMETPMALLWTAKTLYPEYTRDLNLSEEIKEFYSRFFNLNVDDTLLDSILEGKEMRLPKGDN